MVKEIYGDLLSQSTDILCHQTNYYGVMGAGIAWSIREKLLNGEQYKQYLDYCSVMKEQALGNVQYIWLGRDKPCMLANCFSQCGWAVSKSLTDYEAFQMCMKNVEKTARERGYTVALPGYMGCGIAGGDWVKVHAIIVETFGRSPVPLNIVYKEVR